MTCIGRVYAAAPTPIIAHDQGRRRQRPAARRPSRADAGWRRPTPSSGRCSRSPSSRLVDESCADERRLRTARRGADDADRRASRLPQLRSSTLTRARTTAVFLAFRDAVVAAGSARGVLPAPRPRAGPIAVPPAFIDARRRGASSLTRRRPLRCAIRAGAPAQLLYRTQRVAVRDGRVLCADRDARRPRRAASAAARPRAPAPSPAAATDRRPARPRRRQRATSSTPPPIPFAFVPRPQPRGRQRPRSRPQLHDGAQRLRHDAALRARPRALDRPLPRRRARRSGRCSGSTIQRGAGTSASTPAATALLNDLYRGQTRRSDDRAAAPDRPVPPRLRRIRARCAPTSPASRSTSAWR